MKRNLVVVRAGPSSLHPNWLLPAEERNWDLVVNYFGDDHDQFREPGMTRIDSKGPKWPALHELFSGSTLVWEDYQYVWLPDDDLLTHGQDINRFFEIVSRHSLDLAQPSLTWESHVSHLVTVNNPEFQLRFTNFVEIMAPCLSARMLRRCLPSFKLNRSGWGLDYIWPRWVEQISGRTAVIDEVSVTHTRPVGGPNYASLKAAGITPFQEMQSALEQHGITDLKKLSIGGITREGESLLLHGPKGELLIERLCIGWGPFGHRTPGKLIQALNEHLAAHRSAGLIRRLARAVRNHV